jgi:dTDP-4-dehydrorhamnose reductase
VTGPRWFVTGAGGQLATEFARLLEGEVFLSREEALDIRDAHAVRAAVRGFEPDVVLHTAAYTDVDGAEADPAAAESVNVGGTRNVVAALRGTHTALVYFSTDYVFDGEKRAPYLESDAPRPLGVYGRTKLEGERIVLEWPHGIVIRTSWLFSATGRNFVKTILAAATERAGGERAPGERPGEGARPGDAARIAEPLRVVDDQIGSPTFAGHLAAAVDEALRLGVGPGIYHMAGSGYCSWLELAREIVALAGLDVGVEPITTAELGRPAPRPAFSALASERPVPRLPHWVDGVAAALERLAPQR